jgi:hypothetical protein
MFMVLLEIATHWGFASHLRTNNHLKKLTFLRDSSPSEVDAKLAEDPEEELLELEPLDFFSISLAFANGHG